MNWVLDTTAFSALMRRENDIEAFIKQYSPKEIATVPPVVAEIHYGINRLPAASRKLLLLTVERDRLLKVLSILPWTDESSVLFGEIKAELEKTGKIVDDFDIATGAIALSHDCGVITGNIKHFERIEGLECMSW